MKPFNIFLFFSFWSYVSFAQTPDTAPWCPPGATWVYRFFSPTSNLYFIFSYKRDTVISGKTVKLIETVKAEFYGPAGTTGGHQPLANEYYYNSNDSVFIFDNNQFKFIYNFNPQVGDKWITGTGKVHCPIANIPDSDTITVTSLSTITFGTKTFNYILTNAGSRLYEMNAIIKNIGSYGEPFPYINRSVCPSSGGFFEGLVCYSDYVRGIVSIPNNELFTCHNIITDIPVIIQDFSFSVYPNPVRSLINLKNLNNGKVEFIVFDVTGKKIMSGRLQGNQVDASSLVRGFYFLHLTINEKKFVSKFIKL
jgi:hypothetical protein